MLNSDIVVYIPLYNNAGWCTTFQPQPGFKYIACDNTSTDGSGEILETKGVTVLRHATNIGRIGNWEFCVQHFINSEFTWLKWLFAGDKLYENAYKDLQDGIKGNPEARLIISEFDIVNDQVHHWQMFENTKLIYPEEALKKASVINWFGAPISTMIHREALLKYHRFSELEWVADMLFCLNIAAEYPALYLKKKTGAFYTKYRNYYRSNNNSPLSCIEEALASHKALKRYFQLTGDTNFYNVRGQAITQELVNRLNTLLPANSTVSKDNNVKRLIKKMAELVVPNDKLIINSMQIISHRGYWKEISEKNQAIAFERSFGLGFGTETDLRDRDEQIVISHDMANSRCISLEELLSMHQSINPLLPLALNIKSDGLQLQLKTIIEKFALQNYFVFDMSIPDTIGYISRNIKFFSRQSEYEPLPVFYEQCTGIWLDAFKSVWYSTDVIERHVKNKKQVAIVSPDLHKREVNSLWNN